MSPGARCGRVRVSVSRSSNGHKAVTGSRGLVQPDSVSGARNRRDFQLAMCGRVTRQANRSLTLRAGVPGSGVSSGDLVRRRLSPTPRPPAAVCAWHSLAPSPSTVSRGRPSTGRTGSATGSTSDPTYPDRGDAGDVHALTQLLVGLRELAHDLPRGVPLLVPTRPLWFPLLGDELLFLFSLSKRGFPPGTGRWSSKPRGGGAPTRFDQARRDATTVLRWPGRR